MELAPVVLFTYNRLSHLKTTINKLKEAELSRQSDLYVFSDGPKGVQDRTEVESVRHFLDGISGYFRSVSVTFREENWGLSKNVILGLDEILSQHASVIVLEDDITVSTNYLVVMNQLLDAYKDDGLIGSISGYMYPVPVPPASADFFLLPRASSWGWGTWADRWQGVDWEVKDFSSFKKDQQLQEQFNEGGGDLSAMLFRWKYGLNDSWAVRWSYHHFKYGKYCLFPKENMILNHGNDGSGTHSPNTHRFRSEISVNGLVHIPEEPKYCAEVANNLQHFFKPSIFRKVINKVTFVYKDLIKSGISNP